MVMTMRPCKECTFFDKDTNDCSAPSVFPESTYSRGPGVKRKVRPDEWTECDLWNDGTGYFTVVDGNLIYLRGLVTSLQIKKDVEKLLEMIFAFWDDAQKCDGDTFDWLDMLGSKPAFVEKAEMIKKRHNLKNKDGG